MDPKMRWFSMPVTEQISNIGSEVARALRYKKKGDFQKARNFANKAIEFWLLSEEDPKKDTGWVSSTVLLKSSGIIFWGRIFIKLQRRCLPDIMMRFCIEKMNKRKIIKGKVQTVSCLF